MKKFFFFFLLKMKGKIFSRDQSKNRKLMLWVFRFITFASRIIRQKSLSELREVIKSEGGSFGTLRLTDFLSSETLDLTQIIVMVVVKQGLMVVMRD